MPLTASRDKAIGISPNRIAEIVNNRRRITADTALRLGLYSGTTPEFWMNLQSHYDLEMARRQMRQEDADRILSQGTPDRIPGGAPDRAHDPAGAHESLVRTPSVQ